MLLSDGVENCCTVLFGVCMNSDQSLIIKSLFYFLQVTGSVDFNLKIWDVKTGEEKFKLTGHMASITSVGYSVSMRAPNLKYMFHKKRDFQHVALNKLAISCSCTVDSNETRGINFL